MNTFSNWEPRQRLVLGIGVGILGVLILLACIYSEEEEERPSGEGENVSTAFSAFGQNGVSMGGLFQPGDQQPGSAKTFQGRFPQVHSAKQVAQQAIRKIAEQMDQPIQMVGQAAVGDREDKNLLMMFHGREKGRPVRGVLRVSVAEDTGYVTAVWDEPGRDLMPLMTPSAAPANRQAPPQVRWQNVSLPDGTGSVRLPEGWRITSVNTPQQGALSAEGPHGFVELGYAMQVFTPQAIAMSLMQVPDTLPVAEYSHPTQAVEDVFGIMARIARQSGHPAMQWGRVIESEEAPAPLGGQAAFVHYAWKRQPADQWQPMESLAYVNIAPVGGGAWMYYTSIASAPAATFRQNVKVLLAIWGSWRVSDKVHQSRLAKALQTQQEAFHIQQQSYQYQQQTSDRVWQAWSEYNRGHQAVLDRDRGEVRHLDLRWADEVVRQANQREGTERWIKVDPFQLDY